jgi:hypothetical protein
LRAPVRWAGPIMRNSGSLYSMRDGMQACYASSLLRTSRAAAALSAPKNVN